MPKTQPVKRRRELSPECAAVECQNVNTNSAEASDDAAAKDSGHADQACQTEQAVCSFLESAGAKGAAFEYAATTLTVSEAACEDESPGQQKCKTLAKPGQAIYP
ncbi:hypothetical protein MRX96_027935 [Rhipicephalus microplus]